jgi:hypothetical protein
VLTGLIVLILDVDTLPKDESGGCDRRDFERSSTNRQKQCKKVMQDE